MATADEILLGKLIIAIEKYPTHEWEAAARSVERPPIQNRAVSQAFIDEYVRSLTLLVPFDYHKLNSYVLQGTKKPECRCGPEDECTHWHGSATDPSLCTESWIIRSFTSRTTCRSAIETFAIAAKLTGDESFTHDAKGRKYFGPATVCLHTHIAALPQLTPF